MEDSSSSYNFNCPQFVRFSSDSFQDSLNYNSSSSEREMNFAEQSSFDEESLPDDEEGFSILSSEDQFVVHTNAAGGNEKKLKKKNTVPKPFKFRTDDRLKDTNTNICSVSEAKDFTSQLRHHKPSQNTKLGKTKIMPFHLTEAKKRKPEDDHYLPLAEQINNFQKKIPDRYHTTSQKEFQPQEHWSPKQLRPRTPKLRAVKRQRTVDALSREEEEAKILEEMKAYEFHARPVDPKIYKPALFETKEAKQATKTRPMRLLTAQRSQARQEESCSETAHQFRARPVPRNILSGPSGLGEKPKIKKTKPKSPNFTTEKRLEKRKLFEQEHEVKERPAKKPKVAKKKAVEPKETFIPKRTEIQPFSFDKVDRERYALKEKRIQEEIEKENKPFIFKAQNLPSCDVSKLPDVKKKPPTQAQPFNFCLDNRSFKHSFNVAEKSISFKAQPATVLHKAPFIPEKSTKQTLDFQEFELHTDRRASERLKLKEQKEAEEEEKQRLLLIQKAKEEENERKEILKLRQELVHKANPIRQFKPLEIKPSSIPLTEAISPDFETDKRLRSRHEK